MFSRCFSTTGGSFGSRRPRPAGVGLASPLCPFEVPSMGWAGRKPWAAEAAGTYPPPPGRLPLIVQPDGAFVVGAQAGDSQGPGLIMCLT